MDIMLAGNRLFYMHSRVEAKMDSSKVRLALTPNHPRAFPIQQFSWKEHCTAHRPDATGVELVLGMENGMSPEIVESCDHCVYIPQYGSIGSLSMLSALAIATHTVGRGLGEDSQPGELSKSAAISHSFGHMPLSNNRHPNSAALPHEADLLCRSNDEIKSILKKRREAYNLQLSVIIYNELGDRNIGAVMRNANVFNCEYVAVVNRRRFNRRGAIGTQKVMDVHFLSSVFDDAARSLLDGYEVWLLYPYYPNLIIYTATTDISNADSDLTFRRHDDHLLRTWCRSHHHLTALHPLVAAHSSLQNNPVYLDDSESLGAAVRSVQARSLRGIVLAVPEEGSSPHPSLGDISSSVVYVTHSCVVPHKTQRGLNPALSTAIALERIRSTIDSLSAT